MSGLISDLGSMSGRAFSWWTRELSSLIPDLGRNTFGPNKKGVLAVALEDGALRASPARSGAVRDTLVDDALLDHISHAARKSRPIPVTLTLPESICLSRQIDLPERARAEAAQILALDFERAMPFSASDVYTAHYQDRSSVSAPGTARFTQLVVKRSVVDPAIARLVASGAKVVAVDCAADSGTSPVPVNFLDSVSRDKSETSGRGWGAAPLAALCALLLVSAVWITLSRREQALAQLEQENAEARSRVTAIDTKRGAASAAAKDISAVLSQKAARAPSVHIVNELTRLLPDDVVLSELRIDGDALAITGFAKAAADLVPLLERSSMFSGAALTAPVTFDDRLGKERFSYGLKLRGRAGLAEPASKPVQDESTSPVDPPEGALP